VAGTLWVVERSLQRWLADLDGARLRLAFMEMWQRAAIFYLHARPLFSKRATEIAIDEAIAWRLENQPWPMTLPRSAQPLLVGRRMPRRGGAVYRSLESDWGELFFDGSTPAFFAPAF
jgi:hypothetical protein